VVERAGNISADRAAALNPMRLIVRQVTRPVSRPSLRSQLAELRDVTLKQLRRQQAVLSLVQEFVEMTVSWTHLRALNRSGDFRRQIVDPVNAALKGAKPLQLFEFTCRYEIPAHPDRSW
jgi:glucose-6-phosphate dehydrogenase assembly protein OpcA